MHDKTKEFISAINDKKLSVAKDVLKAILQDKDKERTKRANEILDKQK